MNFGERLEALIEEQELTQRQISCELHIAPTTLNGYIKGNREPDYVTLIGIAEYFDVSIDYLLGVTNVRKYSDDPLDFKEGDLLGIYRCLQTEKQDMLIDQARLFYKYEMKQKERKKSSKE